LTTAGSILKHRLLCAAVPTVDVHVMANLLLLRLLLLRAPMLCAPCCLLAPGSGGVAAGAAGQ
jgi:hypothetical protein